MIGRIKALYTSPTARVKINGTLSDPIALQNGTRQGCPLSPLLFVMTVEPLLARIRRSPDISGVKIGEEEFKLAAFADDVLVYVTRPRITLPNLLEMVGNYGRLSNFRVNATKSEILEVVEDKDRDKAYQKYLPFKWGIKELNYLGVKIPAAKETLFQDNYMTLLNEIGAELNRFPRNRLSWGGRINLIKMSVLPKIAYKIQMLPIAIPLSYLNKLHTLFIC